MNNENILNDTKLSNVEYEYYPSIKLLRLVLMFFMCIYLLGFPTAVGNFVQTVCGFVPLAFYILSGFLVLRECENRPQRILRTIKHTAIAFVILLVVYFAINFFYYQMRNINILTVLSSKRLWFNFLVLNVWPFDIGDAIWYVQALLYAYIIIYFLEKWKLLRFDWLIATVLIVFTVITGELAGVIRWEIFDYNFIPGNFLTRAIPYILLGSFLIRKLDILSKINRFWYVCGIALGIALTVSEVMLFENLGVSGYYGHIIGMGVTAVSLCMLTITDDILEENIEFIRKIPNFFINSIYYICQPVSVGIAFLISALGKDIFNLSIAFIGIITFIVCFFISWLFTLIGHLFFKITKTRKTYE